MSVSCIASTPSNTSISAMSNQGEIEILDQVSRMTLEEPGTPVSPAFQTPQLRKRKPLSIVTPPRGHVVESRDEYFQESEFDDLQEYMNARGLPPLLPDSPSFDRSSDRNPFGRHLPMHSPLFGASNLNAEFLSTLQGSSSNQGRIPRLARRQYRSHLFDTAFPVLEEDDVFRGRDATTGRALKMRRRTQEEYPIFEGSLDL